MQLPAGSAPFPRATWGRRRTSASSPGIRVVSRHGTTTRRVPPPRDILVRRSSKRVVYAALLGNLLVALTKFAAAGLPGSSAMVSEAIHSLVDTGNEILLLHGLRRAAEPPDELHQLGQGRELQFWSFAVPRR